MHRSHPLVGRSRRWASGLVAAVMLTGATGTCLDASQPTLSPGPRLDPAIEHAIAAMPPGDRIIQASGGDVEQRGGRIRVIVKLKQPARMTFFARGAAGLDEIKTQVAALQERFLRQVATGELDVTRRLSLQAAVAGYATEAGMRRMIAMPEVESIVPDYVMYPHTVEGRALAKSSEAGSVLGARGAGVTAAVIDGGFDYTNPELGGTKPRNDSCPSGCSNPVVLYMKDFGNGDDDVFPPDCTTGYHGTGTSAIVRRYAPDCNLVLLKVAKDGSTSAYMSTIADAIDWAAANKNVMSPPIELINLSMGGGKYAGDCPGGVVSDAFANARAAGVTAFVSAGNSGYTNAMGAPGCDPNVIGVGSVFDEENCGYGPFPPAYCWDGKRQANERICYSNASPALDIYAPSEEVITATAYSCAASGISSLGGTSSASPAACGAAAQILSGKPALKGDRDGLLMLMQATGDTIIHSPNPGYQDKRVNVRAALESNSAAPVVNSFTASPSPVAPGGAVTLTWNCSNTAAVSITGLGDTMPSASCASVSPLTTTLYKLTASGPGGTATATTTATVAVTGASMALTPASADFGDVNLGETSGPATFTVHNNGATPLQMGMLYITGPDAAEFEILSDDVTGATIPQSGVRSFDVVCTPTTAGSKSAVVTVASTAGSKGLPVSGNGFSNLPDLSGSWGKTKSRRTFLSVSNLGQSKAASFAVQIYSSSDGVLDSGDAVIKSKRVRSLQGGASTTLSVDASGRQGGQYLIALIDSKNTVVESDETNNTAATQVKGR